MSTKTIIMPNTSKKVGAAGKPATKNVLELSVKEATKGNRRRNRRNKNQAATDSPIAKATKGCRLSAAGRAWMTLALNPMGRDEPGVCGYPDGSAVNSVTPNYSEKWVVQCPRDGSNINAPDKEGSALPTVFTSGTNENVTYCMWLAPVVENVITVRCYVGSAPSEYVPVSSTVTVPAYPKWVACSENGNNFQPNSPFGWLVTNIQVTTPVTHLKDSMAFRLIARGFTGIFSAPELETQGFITAAQLQADSLPVAVADTTVVASVTSSEKTNVLTGLTTSSTSVPTGFTFGPVVTNVQPVEETVKIPRVQVTTEATSVVDGVSSTKTEYPTAVGELVYYDIPDQFEPKTYASNVSVDASQLVSVWKGHGDASVMPVTDVSSTSTSVNIPTVTTTDDAVTYVKSLDVTTGRALLALETGDVVDSVSPITSQVQQIEASTTVKVVGGDLVNMYMISNPTPDHLVESVVAAYTNKAPEGFYMPIYNVNRDNPYKPYWPRKLMFGSDNTSTEYSIYTDQPCDGWNFGVVWMEGVSPNAEWTIKHRSVYQMVAKPGGSLSPFTKQEPADDEGALMGYWRLRNKLPHAYPSSYNDFGWLGNLLEGAAGLIPGVGGFIKPFVKPIMNWASDKVYKWLGRPVVSGGDVYYDAQQR